MIDDYRLMAYSRGMQTIVEMEEYNKKSKDLLDENERENLKGYLAMMPTVGSIMPGTGGGEKGSLANSRERQARRCENHLLLS